MPRAVPPLIPPNEKTNILNSRIIQVDDELITNELTTNEITAAEIVANKITGLEPPVNNTDAVNKFYVDNFLTVSYTRTVINQSAYTLLYTDDIIAVRYTTFGEVLLTLPKITSKKQFTIVDEGGNASTNKITINADGADKIIGQNSFEITSDYNSVVIYNDENNDWFIR